MYRYTSNHNKNLLQAASSLLRTNANGYSHEKTFDPLHYEFDAESMIEPFTYFHNGPTESRRKPNEYPSPTMSHYSWLSTHHTSLISSPDESPQRSYSPIANEQFNHLIQLKAPQIQSQQKQSPQASYPKTICRHCKSHNMPECLYTSHTMYDESGAIFCPVLKKCHCATCIQVTSSNLICDDDSDDDINIRHPSNSADYQSFYPIYPQQSSYRTNNNNNC